MHGAPAGIGAKSITGPFDPKSHPDSRRTERTRKTSPLLPRGTGAELSGLEPFGIYKKRPRGSGNACGSCNTTGETSETFGCGTDSHHQKEQKSCGIAMLVFWQVALRTCKIAVSVPQQDHVMGWLQSCHVCD